MAASMDSFYILDEDKIDKYLKHLRSKTYLKYEKEKLKEYYKYKSHFLEKNKNASNHVIETDQDYTCRINSYYLHIKKPKYIYILDQINRLNIAKQELLLEFESYEMELSVSTLSDTSACHKNLKDLLKKIKIIEHQFLLYTDYYVRANFENDVNINNMRNEYAEKLLKLKKYYTKICELTDGGERINTIAHYLTFYKDNIIKLHKEITDNRNKIDFIIIQLPVIEDKSHKKSKHSDTNKSDSSDNDESDDGVEKTKKSKPTIIESRRSSSKRNKKDKSSEEATSIRQNMDNRVKEMEDKFKKTIQNNQADENNMFINKSRKYLKDYIEKDSTIKKKMGNYKDLSTEELRDKLINISL